MFPTDDPELFVNNTELPSFPISFNEQLLKRKYGVFDVETKRNRVAFPALLK
jgi:hypothetical protein